MAATCARLPICNLFACNPAPCLAGNDKSRTAAATPGAAHGHEGGEPISSQSKPVPTPTAAGAQPVPDLAALVALQDALRAHATPRAAFDAFAARMEGYGFSGVFAGRLSLALLSELEVEAFAYVNAHEEFVEGYLRDGHYSHDPVFARARHHNRPFRWREVHAGLSPAQKRVVDAFAAGGLSHGLCVPIDRVGGLQGLVTLGRGSDFALPPEALLEIEMLARALFAHCDRLLGHGTPPVTLTDRESEVLALVAQGKTNWEAGQILGVSEYSVRDYLRALSERLQTTGRTHTVVRAVQLGLIPA